MLDFWFEFASTYSYPAAMRIGALARDRSVTVRWRPFLLGPVFKAQGWDNSPFNIYPVKGRYMWRDLERICAAAGLPFVRPAVFPQNTILAARVALVAFGGRLGRGLQPRRLWRRIRRGPRHRQAGGGRRAFITALGKDAGAVIVRAQGDDTKLALRRNTEEAQALGIFGAPSVVTADGELFWGNDRLEAALEWARR